MAGVQSHRLSEEYASSMKHSITYFMWGYQPHFRISFQSQAEKVLELIAPDLRPEALLVGVHLSMGDGFDVCVEPEDGKWPISLFDGVASRIDELYGAHPNQQIFYGDAPSNQEKPRLMRADATRDAIQERLARFDGEHGTISFCGLPGRVENANVGEYAVVPVLQFDLATFERYRPLKRDIVGEGYNSFPVTRGLVDAAIAILLDDATREFLHDEPGRALNVQFQRDPTDILRAAGRQLMYRAGWVNRDVFGVHGLFETCTTISSMRHERAESVGGLILAPSDHPSLSSVVRFEKSVPLRTSNWARKILELASKDLYLLCDTVNVYGLGKVGAYDPAREDLFVVAFTGFHTWDLRHADQTLMRTKFGVPSLPAPRFERSRFVANARQMFGEMTTEDAENIWTIVEAAAEQKKGTMVVIASNAAGEAKRLATQATSIVPQLLTPALVQQLTKIDGAVLLDSHGVCHAIGVILDGQATTEGDPARGARYNSAIRYVTSAAGKALAVIISEDGSFDVRPLLPPRVRRSDVSTAVAELHEMVEQREWKNLPNLRRRLDQYRFYLDAEQCASVNADLAALERLVIAAGELWIVMQSCAPAPQMHDGYFIVDAT
jgi:hypothetical protein